MSRLYCWLHRRSSAGGFTLIEILIVVVLLGIVAGMTAPPFSNASTVSPRSTLKEDLRYLRTQIAAFKVQHRGVMPGYPGGDVTATPDEATFLDQMLNFSDEFCTTSSSPSSTVRYGPYLTRMPPNPRNGKTGVLVVTGATMPAADEGASFGWIYNPELQKLQVNLEGSDSAGRTDAGY